MLPTHPSLTHPSLTTTERLHVLRFAASFLWADLHLDSTEREFFVTLARELGCEERDLPDASDLLRAPPPPEEVDPARVPLAVADTVREVALRAIAADGRVEPREMEMWDLLDALLPRSAPAAA